MVCFHPIKAYYPLQADEEGKRHLLFYKNRYCKAVSSSYMVWMFEQFNGHDFDICPNFYDSPYDFPIYYNSEGGEDGLDIKVPCGKCIGCRLDYSRMWATRSVHEAFMNDHYRNCAFLTLTFNPDMLNRRTNPNSLNKTAFRSWIKRLRKAVYSKYGATFRFMACGEYGAKRKRPHYHIIIYGFNFPDKKVFKYNKVHGKEVLYYRSDFLEDIWRPAHSNDSYGFSVIGEVNFESSAYVARYVTKKLCPNSPVYKKNNLEPEFLLTSRMPGLGFDYLKKYYNDIFNHGYITLPNGHKAPIPRYYYTKLQELDPDLYTKYSIERFNNMVDNLFIENVDSTHERLIVREELKKRNLDILYRQYEFS